jgi:hypothetical protein
MEKDQFIEQILETENLTDELTDDDARWLTNWGIEKLSEILQDDTDLMTAGIKTQRLMAVMRKINQIAGSHSRKNFQTLADDLRDLQSLFEKVFGRSTQTILSHEMNGIGLTKLTTRQVLETLTGNNIWLI